MLFDDCTIGIASYNTPEILLLSLKSFIYHHEGQHRIIISENSTDKKIHNHSETELILQKNNINYYLKRPGRTHSPSVQEMMDECKTRYFMLFDSDIVFNNSILPLFNLFKKKNCSLLGEIRRDIAGYQFFPRVQPYFCIMDLKNIKENGCLFHDDKRIDESGSRGFFNNIPIQNNEGKKYYDVGSILYEDCLKKGLTIGDVGGKMGEYVVHVESQSWAEFSKIPGYIQLGKQRKNTFMSWAGKYKDVDIKDKFISWVDDIDEKEIK